MTTRAYIDGVVASGFDDVRTEFEQNFVERGDIGAAVAGTGKPRNVPAGAPYRVSLSLTIR